MELGHTGRWYKVKSRDLSANLRATLGTALGSLLPRQQCARETEDENPLVGLQVCLRLPLSFPLEASAALASFPSPLREKHLSVKYSQQHVGEIGK